MGTLLEGGMILTVDAAQRCFIGDIYVDDHGRIAALGPTGSIAVAGGTRTIDARGCIVCPGFVQVHVHLCQALFRGSAEDRALLPWLNERIWPLEAAHSMSSLRASARLGLAELMLGGTTTCLDMGTLRHTEAIFDAAAVAGMRLFCGKTHMDLGDNGGLYEPLDRSVQDACDLADRYHGAAQGRLHYAFAPRFILSCSEALIRRVADEARRRGCLLHTHSSENPDEVTAVRAATGKDNLFALHDLGLSGKDVVLAHCVWLSEHEKELLARTNTVVAHCPSTNLKLASGVANIPELRSRGVRVGIGADGAPCNNRLSAFTEMRLASLLQKPLHGATAMPATDVLRMMTMGGAEALGISHEVGSLEVGKQADIVVIGTDRPHLRPRVDPTAMLVFAAEAADVRHVMIGGQLRVRDGELTGTSLHDILSDADAALAEVWRRAAVPGLASSW
jgi:5-methylthioadenosine/S-adenosylhomocysteine deaminase